MAQECGFFNALLEKGEYDRVYTAEQFAAYFAAFIGNGIYGKSMQQLQVVCQEQPNMSIKVLPGEAFINGWWYKNTDEYAISIDIGDGFLSRIDVVVLRWGNVERDIWLQVIPGTPGPYPLKPSIRRDADYYDLQLAVIDVSGGTYRITQSQIEDTRLDSSVCGLVTGVVDQIDTTGLYNQFGAYFEEFKNNSGAEFNQLLVNKNTEFSKWFEIIKGQLSEDAAGNLQNEINSIKAVLREIDESEIDDIVDGTYISDEEGGIEPDIYSRITKEEIVNAVNNAFNK